jgi:tRNA(adenine34) deaminase
MNNSNTEQLDFFYMKKALELAECAANAGEVPVGAIIVKDGKIVAQSMNNRHRTKDPTGHAEIIAIKQAADQQADWRLEEHTLYVTLEPCPMCAGAIYASRIKRCVFGAFDPKAGFVGSLFDINSIQQLNHHFDVTGGVLENECSTILSAFFKNLRKQNRTKKGYKE